MEIQWTHAEFWSLFASVVSVLSLFIGLFSARAADRSATAAESAERRAAAATRQAAVRELARTCAAIGSQAEVVLAILVEWANASRSLAVATGQPGGAIDKRVAQEIEEIRLRVEQLAHDARGQSPVDVDDGALLGAQVLADQWTLELQSVKENAERRLSLVRAIHPPMPIRS